MHIKFLHNLQQFVSFILRNFIASIKMKNLLNLLNLLNFIELADNLFLEGRLIAYLMPIGYHLIHFI